MREKPISALFNFVFSRLSRRTFRKMRLQGDFSKRLPQNIGHFLENIGHFLENIGRFSENIGHFLENNGLHLNHIGLFCIISVFLKLIYAQQQKNLLILPLALL